MSEVNQRGGILFFSPSYCWDLNPLDNSAFGRVKKFMQDNLSQTVLSRMETTKALGWAFRVTVVPSAARHFFRKVSIHGGLVCTVRCLRRRGGSAVYL